MDYSIYTRLIDLDIQTKGRPGFIIAYLNLVLHFFEIASVLQAKITQIGNFDRQFLMGFSFGARLCVHAGSSLRNQTNKKVSRMDLCDPAAPFFDGRTGDSKYGAEHVSCIHTSIDKGTRFYDCHKNYRMGYCGYSQVGAGRPPYGSHGLCPYFYLLAFEQNFVRNNYYNCFSDREITNYPNDLKMGYHGNTDRLK
jgi:hypothetical protein